MFILSVLKDVVQVHPTEFGKTRNVAVTDALNRKYANKVLHNIGLCIRVFDLLEMSPARVDACMDGSYTVQVRFRLVVFRPSIGEVLVGRVVGCHQDLGIKITMDFFDDIQVPVSQLPENTEYDQTTGLFHWRYSGEDDQVVDLPIDKNGEVAFRVLAEKFEDAEPAAPQKADEEETKAKPPYQIMAAMNEEGLGMRGWWAG